MLNTVDVDHYSMFLALGDFSVLLQLLWPAVGVWACVAGAMTFGVLTDGGSVRHKIIWCSLAVFVPVLSLLLYFCLKRGTRQR